MFSVLLFFAQHQENLFICLAAVLNMGNIKFGEDENEYSFVKDKTAALATVAVKCCSLQPYMSVGIIRN